MKPILVIAALCCVLSSTAALSAHPFHGSVGEMRFDESSKRLEIAIRIWPADLERAMQIKFGTRVDLDSETPDVVRKSDRMLSQYLQASFFIQNEAGSPFDGRALASEFIGRESEGSHLWVYVEIPLDSIESLEGMRLTNRICFESMHDQSNSLTLIHAQQRITFRSNRNQPSALMTLNKREIDLSRPVPINWPSSAPEFI